MPSGNSLSLDALTLKGPLQPEEKSCKVCAALESLFTERNTKVYFDTEIIFDTFCKGHDPLLRWIADRYDEHDRREEEAGVNSRSYRAEGFFFSREDGGVPYIAVADYKHRTRGEYQILLHGNSAGVEVPDGARTSAINPEWADLGIARAWMERCIDEHASKCQSPLSTEPVSPAWLIDTKDDCLVPGRDGVPFVALSYRWGSSTSRPIDKDIFKQMTALGGLSQQNSHLTTTVRHAIHVVRTVGERYLWVDAVCLEPEDEEQMSHQLQLMGAIYASAKLTIVGLDGDASTGFQGLESQSPPRKLSNLFPWTENTSVLVRHLPILSTRDVDASEYFSRGWTYQEYMLSQRRLIFGNQQLHWKCSCAEWHEDLPTVHDVVHAGGLTRAVKSLEAASPWPDFTGLWSLINEYNSRDLRYPEDAFPAVNGLLECLGGRSFQGGFLFGLPRASFDAALMWTCSFGTTFLNRPRLPGLRRRKPSDRHHSVLPNTHLPSWSWVGWSGYGINMLVNEAQFELSNLLLDPGNTNLFQRIRQSAITIPITEWFSHTSPDRSVKQPILRPPTVYGGCSTISYNQKVWTRKDFVAAEHGHGNEKFPVPFGFSGKHIYEHVSFPGKYFWWPVPQLDVAEQDAPVSLAQGPFISCQTRRGWFGAMRYTFYSFEVNMDFHVYVFDGLGKLCGWLQLPNDVDTFKFHQPELADKRLNLMNLKIGDAYLNKMPEQDELLELVAICICKFMEIDSKEREIEYIEYYGVLWVEWTDGVAYRRGCGYIRKDLWDQHQTEDVHLMLG